MLLYHNLLSVLDVDALLCGATQLNAVEVVDATILDGEGTSLAVDVVDCRGLTVNIQHKAA